MSEEILLTGVSKSYGTGAQRVTALEDVSLRCERGEILALMGPAVSAKTALLNVISGLEAVDRGQVNVFGSRLEMLSDAQRAAWRARNVGLVLRSCNLLPSLRVTQNMEIPLMLAGLAPGERARRIAAALELAGSSSCSRHWPAQLSAEQQQRVTIARAVAADASLLICDEPTGDLGRKASEEVMELLQGLCRKHGKTIVLATQDPFVAAYASRTVLAEKGSGGGSQLIGQRPPAEVLRVGRM